MKKVAIIYGSSGGNTQDVAKKIARQLNQSEVMLYDVATLKNEDFNEYPNLILGSSTYGMGDLQDDWDVYLGQLKKLDLRSKTIALFGLGDSSSFSGSFADALGILYETIQASAGKLVGKTSTEGYDYDCSRADLGGTFAGLVIDEDNESDKTDERIAAWVADIQPQFQ